MGRLETDLDRLSQSMLGERLVEIDSLAGVLDALRSGADSVTITFWWDEARSRRQSVVLEEIDGEDVLLFDPTHSLQATETDSAMVKIPLGTLAEWFEKREAVGLLSQRVQPGE